MAKLSRYLELVSHCRKLEAQAADAERAALHMANEADKAKTSFRWLWFAAGIVLGATVYGLMNVATVWAAR